MSAPGRSQAQTQRARSALGSPMSTTPESVGMSGERLARIDRSLAERCVGPGRLPGVQLLVAHDGQVVHQTLLGHADFEAGREANFGGLS